MDAHVRIRLAAGTTHRLQRRAAVYLVEVDRALAMRFGATRLLLQAQDDEAMFVRRPAARANETVFNSARGLFSDTSLGLEPTFRRSS